MPTKIADGVVVSLEYALHLGDGEIIDRSSAEEPLLYLHGAQNIIPGLEQELTGLAVGDSKSVVVPPEGAYGTYDKDDVEAMDRAMFPPDLELAPGLMLSMRDDKGRIYEATVKEVSDTQVTLDFNHPLAGETLHFDVKVADLRHATEEELAHGHVHAPGHQH